MQITRLDGPVQANELKYLGHPILIYGCAS